MTVNIVTETSNLWILHRCATELAKRYDFVRVNGSRRADVNYYLPQTLTRPIDPGRKMALFTHPTDARLQQFGPMCVEHTCMNQAVYRRLVAAGYTPTLIRPGAWERKPIRFGVVGHVKRDGRKGEDLVKKMRFAGFDVTAHGRGWPCKHLSDDIADLPRFYAKIDYLVITSLTEGGPMPMVDAIARGVPVIAPDVGWCWEFPCIRYEVGQWDSLRAVLTQLTEPPTWQAWADGHGPVFDRLRGAA